MAKKLPYFEWYPADCDTDENVRGMNDQELGFYLRCLNHAWINGSIPSDHSELGRVLSRSKSYVERLWPRVGRCFKDNDSPGRLVNGRQEAQRDKARIASDRNRENVRTRYDKPTTVEESYQSCSTTRGRAIGSGSVVGVSSDSEEGECKGETNGKPTVKERTHWFDEEFWIPGVVWQKIGYGAALKSWLNHVKTRNEADAVIAGAKKQAQSILQHAVDHNHSVLHPATWMNQERWRDEPSLLDAEPDWDARNREVEAARQRAIEEGKKRPAWMEGME